MSVFDELKRRRVFRAAFLYLAVAWVVIQAADLIAPRVGLPDWIVTFFIIVAALGFPLALVLAWLYDIRPDAARASLAGVSRGNAAVYLGIGIVIALVGFAAYSRIGPRASSAGADTSAPSIAVLPFVNMSADREQEYFSDGLTEELLNALSQVSTLRVAARTSSFSFKGKNLPVAEIARVLNVRTVLEGSVRKAGNRVRITAQLINAADGYHIWSETFDRELTDIFAIQEEISRSIADALQLRLAAQDSASLRHERHDLSAYDMYLRARFLWNQRTAGSLREARQMLQHALQIDPRFARAYSALADVYAVWNDYAVERDPTAADRSLQIARQALELDSTLAEPHATIGNSYYRVGRWQQAEAEFKRAIAMKPGYATAHQWYAWMLTYTGRLSEGLKEIEAGLAVDPLNLIINENRGEHLVFLRRFDEAIQQARRTFEMDSTFIPNLSLLANAYSWVGDNATALHWTERLLAQPELGTYDLGSAAFVLARAGQRERALEVLSLMEKRAFWSMTAPGWLALGDTARALTNLEKDYAAGAHESLSEMLMVSAATAGIRAHPRVKALRIKLHLPEHVGQTGI